MTARANAPQPTASVLKTSEESNVKATLEVLIMFISMSTVVFTRVTTVKLIEITFQLEIDVLTRLIWRMNIMV